MLILHLYFRHAAGGRINQGTKTLKIMDHTNYDTLIAQLNRELENKQKNKARIRSIIEESECPYLKKAINPVQK